MADLSVGDIEEFEIMKKLRLSESDAHTHRYKNTHLHKTAQKNQGKDTETDAGWRNERNEARQI